MPSSVVILDSQHRMIFATHYPPPLRPQDVLGKTPWDAGTLAKEHQDEWRHTLERSVATGVPQTVNAYTKAVGVWQTRIYPAPVGAPFGSVVLSEQIPEEIASLAPRERRMARLMVRDKSDEQIAEALNVGIGTVKNLRGRLARKLGVRTRRLRLYLGNRADLLG